MIVQWAVKQVQNFLRTEFCEHSRSWDLSTLLFQCDALWDMGQVQCGICEIGGTQVKIWTHERHWHPAQLLDITQADNPHLDIPHPDITHLGHNPPGHSTHTHQLRMKM